LQEYTGPFPFFIVPILQKQLSRLGMQTWYSRTHFAVQSVQYSLHSSLYSYE